MRENITEPDGLLVGMEVVMQGMVGNSSLNGLRGRIVDTKDSNDYMVLCCDDVGVVSGDNLQPVPCSHCGADLYSMRKLLHSEKMINEQLQEDVEALRLVADAHDADAEALRAYVIELEERLKTSEAASSRQSEMIEKRVNEILKLKIEEALTSLDDAIGSNDEKELSETKDKLFDAELKLAIPTKKLEACNEASRSAYLALRTLYDSLCGAHGTTSSYIGSSSGYSAREPTPEFVLAVQKKRLTDLSQHLTDAIRHTESCYNWIALSHEHSGGARPSDLPAAPSLLPQIMFGPEIEENKEATPTPDQGKTPENLRSTSMQRYMGTDQELRAEPYRGKTHMISICLDYKGTRSPLNCTVDGNRLTELAAHSGVRDIVKLYDDRSTELWPSLENVIKTLKEVGSRCNKGDFLVVHYSGHGGTTEDLDGDEESGFDQTLCLRKESGEVEDFVDDDLSKILATVADPSVGIFFLADACHSGTILDLGKDDLWEGKRTVISLSGCQDTQCSADTGDGGAMTNALLKILKSKMCKNLRKKRKATIQWVFNRMVETIKQPDDAHYAEDPDDAPWDEDIQPEVDDVSETDYMDILQAAVYGIDPGQDICLSWCEGCDPTTTAFPF
eukprot:TRINITY_DN15886_c0_g1_i1.p1 TRINITY_DN15886_c0_g1~~TRINITY_DN15886_c0_g1_i1.p1  ORF type:complete len:618 (+),score=126.13 TRINITY_DN15886_c0_g1_i1:68-1921(+)